MGDSAGKGDHDSGEGAQPDRGIPNVLDERLLEPQREDYAEDQEVARPE